MRKLEQNRELALFRATPAPALVLLPDAPRFTIVAANDAYMEVTKTFRDDLYNHGLFEAFPANPADPDSSGGIFNVSSSLESVIATSKPHKMEVQKYDIPLRDTDIFEERFWRAENIPIFDKNGKIEFILHTVEDITNKYLREKAEAGKLKAEQARDEGIRRLNAILESIQDTYYVVDENWRIVYWNAEAEEILGKKESEVRGKILWDVFPVDEKGEIYQNYHKAMETCKTVSFEHYYEPVGRWFDVSAYPCDNGIAVFLKDVSDRKSAEEERERLIRELLAYNNELRQFSYITSHNLLEPVTTIQSLLAFRENRLEEEEVNDIFNDIAISVEKLRSTIDDLIEILFVKNKLATVTEEELYLEEIFKKILREAEELVEQGNPLITYDFREAPSVIFNQAYLEDIFLNLLTNAFKFRSPSRQLEIMVSSQNRDDYVHLIFQDNGVGLDIKENNDRFFGLYQTFHDDPEGKGLGLYMVKAQVEELGGTIEVSSDVDKGMAIIIGFKKKKHAV